MYCSNRTKRRRIRSNVEKAVTRIVNDDANNLETDNGAMHAEHEFDCSDTNVDFVCDSQLQTSDSVNVSTSVCTDSSNVTLLNDAAECSVISSASSCSCSSADNSDAEQPDDENLADELADWAFRCNIPQIHVRSLRNILQKYHPCLPKDPRTILKTARAVNVQALSGGGGYHHFGVKQTLQNMWMHGQLHMPLSVKQLLLQINIDGLQLFKSSSYQLWPILGTVVNANETQVFEIGLFGGYKKPSDVGEFMSDFASEMKALESDGLLLGDVVYSIKLHSIVCDAPARAYVKCIKSHNSYYGCERCTVAGKWVTGRVTFPEVDKPLRTDSTPTEGRRMSRPSWLVTYRDGLPIRVLTGSDVAQLR